MGVLKDIYEYFNTSFKVGCHIKTTFGEAIVVGIVVNDEFDAFLKTSPVPPKELYRAFNTFNGVKLEQLTKKYVKSMPTSHFGLVYQYYRPDNRANIGQFGYNTIEVCERLWEF